MSESEATSRPNLASAAGPDPDRLFNLLPAIYRMRDVEHGNALRALLRVVGEQLQVVEDDVGRMYDNWFIETCEDWVVPYLGDLIGYRLAEEAGPAARPGAGRSRLAGRVISARREVALTLAFRRRKGSLALLEELARAVSGWAARAVEFRELSAALASLRTTTTTSAWGKRNRTVDFRTLPPPGRLVEPFEQEARWPDVRRAGSALTPGRPDPSGVGLFVWRLQPFSVTCTAASRPVDGEGSAERYTFSVLGNNSRLYVRPDPEDDPAHIAEEANLPVPIRMGELRHTDGGGGVMASPEYYGTHRSFAIWVDEWGKTRGWVPRELIFPMSLTTWQSPVPPGRVAVDPRRGRILFAELDSPPRGVRVYYNYGFSAPIGGGEYERAGLGLGDDEDGDGDIGDDTLLVVVRARRRVRGKPR